ncbi:MAG: amino acid ABC transporter substrate-binding protein [Alphaproteobacteria bacterium]|nr:amino acid ABC transporter substrate-binding protein [Alphaproteobacteria bacterium]
MIRILDRTVGRERATPFANMAFLLTACAIFAFAFASPLRAESEVRFGASLSLTGNKATEGRLVKDGYDFYVKHINERGGIEIGGVKHKVSIVYYDDESDPKTAVLLVEKLIVEDGIKFLLGPYSSGLTFPTSSVAEKHRIPMVEANGAASTIFERGYKYIFATLNSVDQYTSNIIKMAAEAKPRAQRVALISENALFPKLGIDGAERQAKELGLDIVYKEYYPSGTKDLSSMLAAIKETKPDVLVAGGYTGDMILLARQAREMGVSVKMMAFLLGPTLPGFVKSLGGAAENLLEPIQWSSNMPWKDDVFGYTAAEFAELFERDFGYEPDYHPPQAAAALLVYQHALQKVGELDPQKVRDAIAETDIMTFYGPVRFNEKGQNIAKSMAVIQIQKGKPVVVYPATHAQGEFVYPMSVE